MNVSVTSKQAKYVARKVTGGDYASASEVVRESLRRMEAEEAFWSKTRRKVKHGLADIDRGEDFDGETVMAELRGKLLRASSPKRRAS